MKNHDLMSGQSLLLIIDLQEKLMKTMDKAEKVYRNTRIMLGACQQLKIPVVVTEQYPKGLGRTVSDVAEHLDEHLLLEKVSFSAATEEMFEQLRGFQRRQLLVVGSETHVCVFQTVRDLLAAGYEVYVLRDAVCSRRKENYKNGLQLMKDEGAVITDTETAFFDLLKVSGTPDFKAIHPLIK
ncbi:MAG: isochorismatase family protein [Syntrophaceticus sp.]|mgnify:CR=1 FL=1|nr:isochorismatase family protein [Syntrophaceticus sp.]MDD3315352.1 isochorismatase family protein [Syntrophaceticus sp.]MDD4359694.1 isochorismatase family protein [Syntrophaceticus sp.]MDD4782976.1 isochorismatase family protein [Syntrophaceticus sp.]